MTKHLQSIFPKIINAIIMSGKSNRIFGKNIEIMERIIDELNANEKGFFFLNISKRL
ncbi:MAG: hypothetical protein HN427_07120 [Flavobacteriales bacterium]|jgi:hypothetical protein|nr:hypothetical protein [Flavobacteriales bacterium]MBT6013690.1 hypothetical protein [Flavobacteriales bacterium]MBT7481110.1 hypothetical protein [Flavobacteriales bacterium]